MTKILLVENDFSLANSLEEVLLSKGYGVKKSRSLSRACQLISQENFSLAIIDRVLDDGDGLDLLAYLDALSYSTRTLILSQKKQIFDKLAGLSNGADDYLTKPFVLPELILRIQSLLEKEKIIKFESFKIGTFKFFPDTGLLQNKKVKLTLRRKEADLLTLLFKYKNLTVTKEMIVSHLYIGESKVPSFKSIAVYIRRLRMQLGSYGSLIKTVKGFGYQLRQD
ncbi:MAG: response regulator transcription factor [Candidatus Woesebacteria bacterium]|jgi:two-component system cell cycle response regulator CtrA